MTFNVSQTQTLSPTQALDNRFQNQLNRTEWGVQNGTMSAQRGDRIEARDARILNRADQDEAANGGQLTPPEAAALNSRLNNVSGTIYSFNQGQYPGPMLPT